jgi:hypothetical protein
LRRAKETKWVVRTNPYEGGSDHTTFGDAGIPSVLNWHFTDRYYHTNLDRPDKTSAAEMVNVGVAVATSAWLLATADERDANAIVDLLVASATARLALEQRQGAALVAAAADRDKAEATEAAVLAAWRNGIAKRSSVRRLPVRLLTRARRGARPSTLSARRRHACKDAGDADVGGAAVRGSIAAATIAWAAAEWLRWRQPARGHGARAFWTAGATLLVVHSLAVFHYIHGWSQDAALEHTARQTAALTGFDWGGGLCINCRSSRCGCSCVLLVARSCQAYGAGHPSREIRCSRSFSSCSSTPGSCSRTARRSRTPCRECGALGAANSATKSPVRTSAA